MLGYAFAEAMLMLTEVAIANDWPTTTRCRNNRLSNRDRIIPLRVQTTVSLPGADELETFFGVSLAKGAFNGVVFSASDAQKPFLTSNAGLWSIFEPALQKRMQDLEDDSQFCDRVRACLMEVLASGQVSIADVAKRLALSPRTLQRRLQAEDTSFKQELSNLRSELANHYLVNRVHPTFTTECKCSVICP